LKKNYLTVAENSWVQNIRVYKIWYDNDERWHHAYGVLFIISYRQATSRLQHNTTRKPCYRRENHAMPL